MRPLTLSMMLLITTATIGCGAGEAPKPPVGRCYENSDCPEGFRCKETYCEDMYFPRKDIKPY